MAQIPNYAAKLRARYDALLAIRTPWESLWEEVATYILPRRSPQMNGTISLDKDARLFDTTAGQANMTLANGQLAWMSPQETPWFSFTAMPGMEGNDEVTRWLSRSTDRTREALANSNFYTNIHEFYLDRGGFGTGCLYIGEGKKSIYNVECWPVGSYVLDEDDEGNIDTVIRCFKLTARQAKQKFGEENLSPKMKKRLAEGGPGEYEKLDFLHFIMPRDDADRDQVRGRYNQKTGVFKMDGPNMPIASIYMEADGSHVCRVSGYPEMPVFPSRYLEWNSGMGNLWGWAPGYMALPDARQLNYIQKMLDALAEKAAFPPVLAPSELEGEIDPNAGGVTYYDRDLAAAGGPIVRELSPQGRYDIGKDRVLTKQESINKAYHVDLFQMFAQLDKQMTAREVAERSSEKLIQFSPTFSRLTTELFNPLLARLFAIGLRKGLYGRPEEIPQAAMRRISGELVDIPTPQVQYSSRIALAMKQLPSMALDRTLERVMAIGQAQIMGTQGADVMDNFDWDNTARETALGDGTPADFILPTDKRDKLREDRAAAQQAAMEREQAMATAEAAAKVGGIPPESPVSSALQQQIAA